MLYYCCNIVVFGYDASAVDSNRWTLHKLQKIE